MKLGEIIKKFRYDNDMTMQDFADKSGLSKGYISMLEKNKHPQSKRELVPSFETYKKVASAMCMPLDDFLAALDGDEVVKVNAAAPADPLQLTEQEKHIISIYHDLDRVGQEKFTAFGEGLLAAREAAKGESNSPAEDAEREVDRIVAQELLAAKESIAK